MKVVSNTSPIIFLRHAGCLNLLSSCFGHEAVLAHLPDKLGEKGKGSGPFKVC